MPCGMRPPLRASKCPGTPAKPRAYPLWAHGCVAGACGAWRGAGTCVGVSVGRWVPATASCPDQRCPEGGLASVRMCTGRWRVVWRTWERPPRRLGVPPGCFWCSCLARLEPELTHVPLGGWRNAISVLPESSWCCCSLHAGCGSSHLLWLSAWEEALPCSRDSPKLATTSGMAASFLDLRAPSPFIVLPSLTLTHIQTHSTQCLCRTCTRAHIPLHLPFVSSQLSYRLIYTRTHTQHSVSV